MLPLDKRNVNIYIFVSSIPILSKKYIYSFEELLYQKKINVHKTINKIENILYDNAVDFYINYDINQMSLTNIPDKMIDISTLNTSRFNSYFIEEEINRTIYIIKRLFLEISNVFTYNDLFNYVKSPPFKINFNSNLISEDSFIVSLFSLLHNKDNLFNINQVKESQNINLFLDSLLTSSNKNIVDIDLQSFKLININDFFIIIDNNKSIDIDNYYRNPTINTNQSINLNDYIQNSLSDNIFIDKKNELINTYKDNILSFYKGDNDNILSDRIIYLYNKSFQILLIEYLIQMVYNILINNHSVEHEYNYEIYVGLLYYYRIYGLVILLMIYTLIIIILILYQNIFQKLISLIKRLR